MNKKIIVFICILSLLVPFFPQFDFVVRAEDLPSTSEDFAQWLDDNFYTDALGSLRPKTQAPLYMKVNWALTDAGYVLKDPVSALVDSLQSATNLQLLTKENVMEYGQSINYDYSSLSQNIVNNTITYANNNISYYIYRSMPVSEFFSYFVFNPLVPASSLQTFKNWIVPLVNNNVDTLCGFYCYSFLNDGTNYLVDYSDILNDYTFALYSGDFYNYPELPYQSYEHTAVSSTQPYPINSILKFFSNDVGSLYDGTFDYWQPSTGALVQSGVDSHSVVGMVCNRFYPARQHNFCGTIYLSPDSVGSISFPVFRSAADLQLFYKGRSNIYKFDSSIDLSQYGDNLDYSKLYDIVSSSIRGSSGNVIDAINNAVDNYLQEQVDLLHDINNALNDGLGQSWLRRIYGLLDYNFPLTLNSLHDLLIAIQNLSISGGGSDLTHINRVLDEINDKLGFMIEEPLTNADIEDMNDLKNLASQKFPFCVFSDIVAISVILNQTPEEPHWLIPLKLPGSQSVNNIEVDLSWYEDVRNLVHGVFIFIFIVGLLALSVKVFSALKS